MNKKNPEKAIIYPLVLNSQRSRDQCSMYWPLRITKKTGLTKTTHDQHLKLTLKAIFYFEKSFFDKNSKLPWKMAVTIPLSDSFFFSDPLPFQSV